MNTQVPFRKAVLADQAALSQLMRRASLANVGDRQALLAQPEAMEVAAESIELGHVLLVELDGEIVGFATVLPRPDAAAQLEDLFIEPHFWRQGFGKALVEQWVSVCRLQGIRKLHVVGNYHAAGFYTSCEFEKVGMELTEYGEAHSMVREIEL